MAMPYWAGWLEDVLDWVQAAPTPPPSPPSPPASSWFMGIKPIKMPKAVKPDDALTSSEIDAAEKDFYYSQAQKNFYGSGGTVSLELKTVMTKVTVCSTAPAELRKEERRQLKFDDKFGGGFYGDGPPPEEGPPPDFKTKEEEYKYKHYGLYSGGKTEPSADMQKQLKAPVAYADDFLYRSYDRGVIGAVNVPIDVEQMMVYEKERAAALWQEVPGVETPVPMFYFSSAIIEPGFVAPVVPPAPSPPPLSVCKSKLVEIDAIGSAGSLSATKLEVLKVLLDSNFGPRRPIENLDAAAWSTSGLSYSKGSAVSLVAMDDKEGLKEAAESSEGFLAKAANGYTGGSSKSLIGALKVAGKPAMSIP